MLLITAIPWDKIAEQSRATFLPLVSWISATGVWYITCTVCFVCVLCGGSPWLSVRFLPCQVISGFVWRLGGIISIEEERLLGKLYPGASFLFVCVCFVFRERWHLSVKIIVFPRSMCVCVCLLMYMPASISDLCIGVRVGVFLAAGVCVSVW